MAQFVYTQVVTARVQIHRGDPVYCFLCEKNVTNGNKIDHMQIHYEGYNKKYKTLNDYDTNIPKKYGNMIAAIDYYYGSNDIFLKHKYHDYQGFKKMVDEMKIVQNRLTQINIHSHTTNLVTLAMNHSDDDGNHDGEPRRHLQFDEHDGNHGDDETAINKLSSQYDINAECIHKYKPLRSINFNEKSVFI